MTLISEPTLRDTSRRTRTPLVGLRSDVRADPDGEHLVVVGPWGSFRVRGVGASVAMAFAQLELGGVDLARLTTTLAEPGDVARLHLLVERLSPVVTHTVVDADGRRIMTAVPITRSARAPESPQLTASSVVTLSRFAYQRRLPDGDLGDLSVLESPLSAYRVELADPRAAAVVSALASPQRLDSVLRSAGVDGEAWTGVVELLVATGFAAVDGAEEPDDGARLWDFHDLVFHARSRPGRHDYPFGAVFAHDDVAIPPTLRPSHEGPAVELARPRWDDVVRRDPRLSEVLEGRTSVREYAAEPVTVEQLGELLYRSCRVRRVDPSDHASATSYDAVHRPYPAGGAMGELEVYVTVASCRGLEPGVYHYESAAHRLRLVCQDDGVRTELLQAASRATAGIADPQVLLTIVSRIGRLSWKYGGIAYALTLKHAGALYQTMYLVATAMGLAPCGLGSGDNDTAARAFGSWLDEPAVGELLIGSRPGGRAEPPTGFADIVDVVTSRRS